MASATELWEAWNDGFAKKDSSRLAELLTDDFRFVSVTRDISKQEALDWTAAGGFQTLMDRLEVYMRTTRWPLSAIVLTAI
ncbi:MAG: hypothetical protein CM1200mP22_07340 [Dehalococcoidia bacterium]|nr:MAG: hypothetical protein CM1200mP22_07340 [Dehalococcoidia bacterium]